MVCQSLLAEKLLAVEILRCVDYMGVQDGVSAHPGFRNVVTNISCLSVNEVVQGDELSKNCKRSMGIVEQESVVFMKDITRKFSKLGKLESDPYAGCFLQRRHAYC